LRGNKRAAPEDSRYPLLTTLAGRRRKPRRPAPRLSYNCASQSSTLWRIWPLSFIHSLRFAVSSKGKATSPFLANADSSLRRNSMHIPRVFENAAPRGAAGSTFAGLASGLLGAFAYGVFRDGFTCGAASCSPRDGWNLTATATASKSAPAEASTEVLN
jgi:hypothetical protein